MKPGLPLKGLLLSFSALSLIGSISTRKVHGRVKPDLDPKRVNGDINKRVQVNDTEHTADRARKRLSHSVDKVTEGNLPLCPGVDCETSYDRKQEKKKTRRGKTNKKAGTRRKTRRKTTRLVESTSANPFTDNYSGSVLDAVLSLWGKPNKSSSSRKTGESTHSDFKDNKLKKKDRNTDFKKNSSEKSSKNKNFRKDKANVSKSSSSRNRKSNNREKKINLKGTKVDSRKTSTNGSSVLSKGRKDEPRKKSKKGKQRADQDKRENSDRPRKDMNKQNEKDVMKKISTTESSQPNMGGEVSHDVVNIQNAEPIHTKRSRNKSSRRRNKDNIAADEGRRRKGGSRSRDRNQQLYDYDYDYGNYDDYYDYNMYNGPRWQGRQPVIYRLPPRRSQPIRNNDRRGKNRNRSDPDSRKKGGRFVPYRRRPYAPPIIIVQPGRMNPQLRPINRGRRKNRNRHSRRRRPEKSKKKTRRPDMDITETDYIKSKDKNLPESESRIVLKPDTPSENSKENSKSHDSTKQKSKSHKKKKKQSKDQENTTTTTTAKPTSLKTTTTTEAPTTTKSTTLETTTLETTTIKRTTLKSTIRSTTPQSTSTSTVPTTTSIQTTTENEVKSLFDFLFKKDPENSDVLKSTAEVKQIETVTVDVGNAPKRHKKQRKQKNKTKKKKTKSEAEKTEEKVSKSSTELEKETKGSEKASSRLSTKDKKLLKEDDKSRWNGRDKDFLERRRERQRQRNRSIQVHYLKSRLAQLSDQILLSLESVLKALRSKVQVAYTRYDKVFNTTRYDIIHGIRNGLYSIVNTNDEIYGIILDMSRLVRHIYKRAHEQHLINPSTRRRKIEQPVKRKDFRLALRTAQQEYNSAIYILNKAKMHRRRCSRMKQQKADLKQRLMRIQFDYRLRELNYFSNRTIRKVENLMNYNMARRKLIYLKDTQNVAGDIITSAKEYNRMAFDHITECTLEGWRCTDSLRTAKEKIRRAREAAKNRVASTTVGPTISPEDKVVLRRALDKANQHAKEQQYLRQLIERQLYPLVRVMQAAIEYKKKGGRGPHTRPRDKSDSSMIVFLKQVTGKIDQALHKLQQRIGYRPSEGGRRCSDVEGSGDGDEECIDGEDDGSGSGASILEGLDGILSSGETDDEDFIFVDRGNVPTKTDGKTFGSLLRKQTGDLKGKSEKLQTTSLKLSQRVADLRTVSRGMLGQASRSVNVYSEAEFVLSDWTKTQTKLEKFHGRVNLIMANLNAFNRSLDEDVDNVNKIVDKVLSKVTGPGKGGGAYAQVLQKVGEAKSNMKSIENIRSLFPDPCARTTKLRDNIRTNLTVLRQNIQSFKKMTAALNIPVSLSGGNYVEVPLTHDRNKSNKDSFEFSMKRSSSDGIVAVLSGEDFRSVKVSLKEGLVLMSVTDTNGAELDSVTSPADLKADTWYRIYINRFGLKYKLTIQALGTLKANGSQSAIVLSGGNPVQVLPLALFIGGYPDKKKNKGFIGCMSDVRYAGREVNIYKPAKTGLYPPTCSVTGVSTSSLIFDGSGFLQFPSTVFPRQGISVISLYFKTLQPNTLLFLLGFIQKDVFLIASIEKGIVVVSMTTRRKTVSQRTIETSYSDGKFYHLKVTIRSGRLSVSINDKSEAFLSETSAEFLAKYTLDYLTVGGVSMETEGYLKRNMSAFSGCVRNFEIDGRELFLSDSSAGQGVSVGTCSEALISNCVKFAQRSKPIILPEFDTVASVSFMFKSSQPKGYFFHYKRGERVDIYLRLTSKGVEMVELLEDDSEFVPLKPDDSWHYATFITVKNTLYVQIDDTEAQEFDVSYGWNYFNQKKDGPVTIAMKLIPSNMDKDGAHFEGSIAQLIVNNNLVDLGVYAIPNNLDGCKLKLSSAQTMLLKGTQEGVC